MLEQDTLELSISLKGEIFEAYKSVVQTEVDKMREVKKLLKQAIEQ